MSDALSWLAQHGLALYASVLATVVFVWQVISYRSTRSRRLRVEVSLADLHVPDAAGQYSMAGRIVDFKARNVGALDVRLNQCGLARLERRLLRNQIVERLALPIPAGPLRFPHYIKPGQSASFHTTVDKWCENPPATGWQAFTYVYFQDALGHYYKTKVDRKFLDELTAACASE